MDGDGSVAVAVVTYHTRLLSEWVFYIELLFLVYYVLYQPT